MAPFLPGVPTCAHAQSPLCALSSNYGRAGSVRAVPGSSSVDRDRLRGLIERERAAFAETHAASRALFEQAGHSLLGGVPMSWMAKWAGGHPVFAERAQGAEIVDVDGNRYVDLCLGDTGAMAGHAPAATVAAIERQAKRGNTLMLPTEDAIWVGEELRRRFGMARWQFTLSATDANRAVIRLARQVTGRPEDPGLQLLLPRDRRRDVHHAARGRQRRGTRGQRRAARGSRGDDQGRRVQRRSRARGRAGARRRRLRAGRARPHEHRDRPARARVPRRHARPDAGRGHPPGHRRDAHDERRAGRLHGRRGSRARPAHRRQGARGRRAGGRVRHDGAARDAGWHRRGGRLRGRGRRGRHAGRQRAVARRHARHTRARAHARGVRGHVRARAPVHRRRARGPRRARRAVAHRAARRPSGVRVLGRSRRATAARPRPSPTASSRSTCTSSA